MKCIYILIYFIYLFPHVGWKPFQQADFQTGPIKNM